MLRRSFLSRFPALAAFAGVGDQKPIDPAPHAFEPVRHSQDDWLDQLPGKHRVVFDTWTAARFPESMQFANNIFRGNRDGYQLAEKDVAIVIVARHRTAPFAFNDAMWAKYSTPMSARTKVTDPKGQGPAVVNVFNASEYRGVLTNGATTIDSLIKLGVHFAVCNQSTLGIAGNLARDTDGKAEAIYKELTSNLIGNAHMVPSGIVAVGHAQERSYAYVYSG